MPATFQMISPIIAGNWYRKQRPYPGGVPCSNSPTLVLEPYWDERSRAGCRPPEASTSAPVTSHCRGAMLFLAELYLYQPFQTSVQSLLLLPFRNWNEQEG